MNDKQVDVKGFFMSRHFYDGIKALSPEQVKDLLLALYADMGCGEMPQLDPITNMVLTMMLPHIHEIQNNALKRKVANQENGKLGGRPRKNQESEENQDDIENEKTQKTIGFLENQPEPLGSEKPHTDIHTENIFNTPNGVFVGKSIPDPSAAPSVPNCPHAKIVELYHECLPELPRVKIWEGDRQSHLQTRWRERWKAKKYTTQAEGIEYWRRLFVHIHDNCPWLMGQVSGKDGRPAFKADLAWLVLPRNFAKLIEGRYDREAA